MTKSQKRKQPQVQKTTSRTSRRRVEDEDDRTFISGKPELYISILLFFFHVQIIFGSFFFGFFGSHVQKFIFAIISSIFNVAV
jgi:hypothetical protein